LFSAFVNILMLAGPLYMLQVYDRVLGSGSEATLVALSILILCLFLIMGVLDHVRGRITAIIGARLQEQLDARVFAAAVARLASAPDDPAAINAQRDVEALRGFLATPVFLALLDLPWTPLFLLALFVFHPSMGWLAVIGGAALVTVTVLNQILTQSLRHQGQTAMVRAERMAEQLKSEAETVQALGMAASGISRWQVARRLALAKDIAAAGVAGGFGALTRTLRLVLQSAMLGLGAFLVLRGELTAGAMVAGSILMGRALSPIEMAVGQWAVIQRAADGWQRLDQLLSRVPAPHPRTALPRPRAVLEVEGLTIAAPGDRTPLLRQVSFRLEPGQALGVIGPTGAGKSTLARALTGVWQPLAGRIRLDGAALDQYDPEVLGRLIGYLPQRITLFDGTIAENIARLDATPDSDRIIAAARKADAHDMIVRLPQGYDTPVAATGSRLSGGQMQRIALARALYGDPVLLVLDEPNANLDNGGSAALNAAIRAAKADGKAVLIMAHRPAAIQECDLLLVIEDGTRRAFGPRDQVLRDEVKNHTEILRSSAPGAEP
jgi:ATP-binding cassette subfamily C protein